MNGGSMAKLDKIAVSPYLLLVLTTLFWSGNVVLARLVRLDVPPIGLSFFRWAIAGLILLPFVWRLMVDEWPVVRRNIGLVLVLALLGITNFNTFIYLGVQSTTAANGALLQSIIPLVIIGLSRVILKTIIRPAQVIGILVSMWGVLNIVTGGDITALVGLDINRGDLWILAAVCTWGLYSVVLKKLPPGITPLSFLGYAISFGVLGILPLYLWEISMGKTMALNLVTAGSVAYVALFPSILAYMFWIHAVHQIGPERSGQFIHLIPVFGSLLAVLFLDEMLHLYHLVGIVLVAAGIYLATSRRFVRRAVRE